jgi:hypothetical protein
MNKCAICGETKEDSYATTYNSEVVYACLDCYLKQCAVINSGYPRDCPECGKEMVFLYKDADLWATWFCNKCLLRYRENDDGTRESKIFVVPQDIQDGLAKISYPISDFVKMTERDSSDVMMITLKNLEDNWEMRMKKKVQANLPVVPSSIVKKVQVYSHPSIDKDPDFPSLTVEQRKIIETHLKNGLSIRSVVRACLKDGFHPSIGTVHAISKKLNCSKSLPECRV